LKWIEASNTPWPFLIQYSVLRIIHNHPGVIHSICLIPIYMHSCFFSKTPVISDKGFAYPFTNICVDKWWSFSYSLWNNFGLPQTAKINTFILLLEVLGQTHMHDYDNTTLLCSMSYWKHW
jgi:hypothetical protein